MGLAGCQIFAIDLNSHLQNVWKFLIKIQLTKSNPKIIRGVNPPCLMPIRVKVLQSFVRSFMILQGKLRFRRLLKCKVFQNSTSSFDVPTECLMLQNTAEILQGFARFYRVSEGKVVFLIGLWQKEIYKLDDIWR